MLGHHDIKPVSHQKSDWPFDFAVDNRVDISQTFSQVSRQVRSDCGIVRQQYNAYMTILRVAGCSKFVSKKIKPQFLHICLPRQLCVRLV